MKRKFITLLCLIGTACSGTNFQSSGEKATAKDKVPAKKNTGACLTGTDCVEDPTAAPTPSGGDITSDITTDTADIKTPNIRIGMLVNDLNCTFCHLEIHGDVGSISTVKPLREDSHGKIFGRWLINGAYNATQNLSNPPLDNGIQITGQAVPTYGNAGHELPVDGKGVPTFPTIDFTTLAGTVAGSVTCGASGCSTASVSKVNAGNLVLIGTSDSPIKISHDVLVQGDLIITGKFTGIGTIYVTGNIYIPANLIAVNKASFPYPDPTGNDYSAADAAAKADMQASKDALALASKQNIFVGDLENYMDSGQGDMHTTGVGGAEKYVSLYDYTDDLAGAGKGSGALLSPRSASGFANVYNWYSENKYQQLYQSVTPCWTVTPLRALVPGHQWGERSINEIDSFLYAGAAIAGIARATNWTINGGMIAQTMHIISGAGSDSINANATCGASRINFDYRMRNHMPLLEALEPYFPNQ